MHSPCSLWVDPAGATLVVSSAKHGSPCPPPGPDNGGEAGAAAGGEQMQRRDDRCKTPQGNDAAKPSGVQRPAYEPPRILKKRSVSRATLASSFGGCGPDGCPPALGVTAGG